MTTTRPTPNSWSEMTDFQKEMDFELGYADSLTHEEIDEMFAKFRPTPSKSDSHSQSINAISIQSKNDPTRQTSQDSVHLTSTKTKNQMMVGAKESTPHITTKE